MRLVPDSRPIHALSFDDRLDELGRIPLVRFDHRPIPSNNPKAPMSRVASAIPAWTQETRDRFNELTWDEFWGEHPAGAGRLVRLEASSFEDAVRAARAAHGAARHQRRIAVPCGSRSPRSERPVTSSPSWR